MPSASSKLEKSASTEAVDPIKQAIVIVGHKIRNLEKRKSRLDSYKESIKSLTKEQIEAISKYDEVLQQLELSKEYVKQFMVISVENDKLKKKQAKKETQEKYLSEVNKIKQVLLIQDILQNLRTDSVREDFLAGQNRAIQLTANDLKTLDDLYIEVSQKHDSENNALSQDQFQKAAEYFMAIIEGKAKEIFGSTGAKIKELITSIHSCGYFDQPQIVEANSGSQSRDNEVVREEEGFLDKREISSSVIVPSQISAEANLAPATNSASVQSILSGPVIPGGQASVVPNQQQIITSSVPNIVPTPVSQVESNFFNAQGFKPIPPPSIAAPPNQNTRLINDVIQSVAGKFNFLQESELDLSEMNPAIPGVPGNTPSAAQIPGAPPSAIPTQTYTNQNFTGQPGGGPSFATNYPPQPAAFTPFVTTFPAFVPPNASAVQNNSPNTNAPNPTVIAAGSAPVNMPTSNSNNKTNNVPNPISLASSRNPNTNFNQGQQPISNSCPSQANAPSMAQPPSQHVFQHGSITVNSAENTANDTVQKENETKEKIEKEKQDWSQSENTNWADECVDPSEWNSPNPNQSEVSSNENKYQGRINRSGVRIARNTNGYQGNRPRSNRQGGYRESQHIPGNGGVNNNYYQNQNGYQSRNDRNNEFQVVVNKGNSNVRDGMFKERGDFSSRDRETRDNYGGGFKRGPSNRVPNPKGQMDRGDRQGQTTRTNPGGPRGQRNLNRQPGGKNGCSFQRLQPNPVEKAGNK